MRFEQIFKNQIISWLSAELTETETQADVVVEYTPTFNANMELLNNPLFKNPDAYGIVVRNSAIVRSNLNDIDFNTITFSVDAVMEENKVQDFLNATERIAKAYDSALLSITDTSVTPSVTLQLKPSFGLAYVAGQAYDLTCENATIGANNVSWLITVQYTASEIILAKPTIKLIGTGGLSWNISNLLEYSLTGQSNCQQKQKMGASRVDYEHLNYTNTYVFFIRKTTATTGLNQYLADECRNAGSMGLTAITFNGSTNYTVVSYTVTEVWRDNIASFQLTINR